MHALYAVFAALAVLAYYFYSTAPLLEPIRACLRRPAKLAIATYTRGTMPATTNPDSISDVVTVTNNTPSKLYALVIGINDYPNLLPLAGAVSDADSVSEFLTTDLGIPHAHITNLRDSSASRAAIIHAFQELRENDQIEYGSPILIYFAGHGGVTPASEDWKSRYGAVGKVQVIFPFDYYEGHDGEKVNCIPDKTVAELLNQLAKAKGNNITVIFDSCHSASGNRASGGRRARSAAVKLAIPADIDDDILLSASTPTSTGSSSPSPTPSIASARHTDLPLCTHQSSHIYFAACGSDEKAWEEDGRGEFTAALLRKIRACGVDKITYHNLMSELPLLSRQTPHCYGTHKSRILFNACVPSRKIAYIPVIYDPARHTLELQAGAASGVTEDSVWEVRATAAEGGKAIERKVKAGPPGVSRTTLMPEEIGDGDSFWDQCEAGNQWKEGKKRLYARLIMSGPGNELRVWFSHEAKRLVFPELERGTPEKSSGEHEVGYVVHSARDSADIAVELYQPEGMGSGGHPGSAPGSANGSSMGPEVVFHLCDPQAEKYGIATLRRRKPARRADVETVLFAAARWNWHLRRTNPARTRASIEVEVFKIAEKHKSHEGYPNNEWSFVAEEERVNLNETGVVDFEVHEKDMYAVRLKSQADVPLYVWLFYFDTTTFSIVKQFEPSVSNSRADTVIPPHGEFVIGDGADGDAPLHFELEPDETLDVGYLKVFWSTDPLELGHLEQDSAFEMRVGTQSRKVDNRPAKLGNEWGTIGLTLVQRFPANKAT